jgi:hypothetical protein
MPLHAGNPFVTGTAGSTDILLARFGPPCYANCDYSSAAPLLTVADHVCFMGRFAAGEPYANWDESTGTPALTVADFLCFQDKFAAGCP